MKKIRPIATIADILIMAVVALINPLNPFHNHYPTTPPHIPDKVEIRYDANTAIDSTQQALINAEVDEMRYYFKVHNVSDEGYHLVARYNETLKQKARRVCKPRKASYTARIAAKDRPMTAVKIGGGYWKAGHFFVGALNGKGIARDWRGRIISAQWDADTVVYATRIDEQGIYKGQMDTFLQACGQGIMDEWDGCHKEGFWQDDQVHGFAFDSSPNHQLRVGEWKTGKFLGEKLKYTTERIYGIDISRHQHEKGRKRYGIDFSKLRITSLGKRHDTEGTTVRNRYFMTDYMKAKKQGIHVGAYHFFSLKSSAELQARYFVNHTLFRKGDFPPVLDVEPTDAQIRKIGGSDALMNRIRIFMQIVERRTGMRPILYVSQMFVNRHMANASDIKQKYNVWIARYSQYKPDVKLAYWQLCPDGRVDGITGEVDINVFNGYQDQFTEFVKTGFLTH